MKKHNDNNGGAPDLDELLQKLKERHDARENAGIFTPEDEFSRCFFQAAHAQDRPHFPMIWKAAAGIAVCLLAFQLVLTTLKDDSSAVRADNYGAQGVDMVADTYAVPVGYGAAALPENPSADAETEGMILASVYTGEEVAEEKTAMLDGEAVVASSFAVRNDALGNNAGARLMSVSSFGEGDGAPAVGMGGFGGAAPAGGMAGGFGGGFGGGF